MEYVEHELKTLLEDNKPEFSQAERKCLLIQLLQAVDCMHRNWVMHRDLKTSNLLYSNMGVLKVCDFGMARKFGDPIKPYTHNVVTLWYRAPEILLGQEEYTQACDVWSAGCIFAELILRKPIFPGHGEADTINRIFKVCGTPNDQTWPGFSTLPFLKNSKYFSRPPNYSNSWRELFPTASAHFASSQSISEAGLDLLQRLLELDPAKRITARMALEHPYFRSEKPRPQIAALMPTVPDTNSQARHLLKKRRRERSAEAKQIDSFHEATYRFSARVDAEQFLSALNDQVKGSKPRRTKIVSYQ
eukprot:GHVT01099132.1.p1 GENE.GHVT01099132.1~~GHVT01099132.1.p1  ORF type:complete len:303 (+),score=21.48 GHVT01099132.1:353-1261(+)